VTNPSPVTGDERVASLASQAAPTERELSVLALGAFLAFILHWHFRLSGFGEQDAARLANDAIHWHAEHRIFMASVDYRLRTSPLYIHSLKLALDHGLRIRALPQLMNGVSAVSSSACLVGLYFLFRRLSGVRIAATAVVIYALTPCFWLGSVYGMPTVPALTFWVFSVLAFARAMDETDGQKRRFFGFLALSLALSCIAFGLKADMALSAGALLTVLLAGQRTRPAPVACAVGVVGGGLAFALLYAKLLAAPVVDVIDPNGPDTLRGFLHSWSARFPLRWSLLVDPKNNDPIRHASGTLLFGLILLALAFGLVSGGARARRTLGLAIWGLTPLLFWGLKSGNSARHNLPAFAPLALVAASFVFEIARQEGARAWAFLGALAAFALLDTSGHNSVNPNVNVITATHEVEAATSALHQSARQFVAAPGSKKAIIEGEYLIAYSEFEVWAGAKSPASQAEPRAVLDGRGRETRVYEVGGAREARALAQRLRRDRWDVFSAQFSL
jgi:Dolichyl-phosphate-mannose-protein mannosyltransferase